MCGIIGVTGTSDALTFLTKGLKALEYRGYDSAGVAFFDDSSIKSVKTVGRITALESKLKGLPTASCGIGHTRWATHGCPNEINCHPHSSFGGKFTLVHNGIIENCDALRAMLVRSGVTPTSDTDSEIVAHLLELHYDGDPLSTLENVTHMLEGSYALAVICADFEGEIFATKRRSPLLIGREGNEVFLASDVTAMPMGGDVRLLADGHTARLSADGFEVFERGKRVEAEKVSGELTEMTATLCGYPRFMLKEIFEQPEAIARTVTPVCGKSTPKLGRKGVLLVGCGSSYHAALACKPLIESVTGMGAEVTLASEFICSHPTPAEGRTCVLISQSGETADTIAAADEALKRGYKRLAITNVATSTLARVCDEVFHAKAGPEIAVATTKGFTTQIASLAVLASERDSELRAEIAELPALAEKALKASEKVEELVHLFTNAKCAFFIGRKSDYGVALEGALKLKEITYIPSIGLAAGELKHGSISLVESGSPVVVVCANGKLIAKTLLSVATVKARGGVTIAVTCFEEVAAACDYAVLLPPLPSLLSPAVTVIPLQLLAYHVAVALNRDVDKPRNLAKSVTVE